MNSNIISLRATGMHTLLNNILSPHLVSSDTLRNALIGLQSRLDQDLPDFIVLKRDLKDYYKHSSVEYSIKNGSILISLPVICANSEELYDMYSLKTYAVPIGNSTTHATTITGFSHYIAISMNKNHYIEVTREHYNQNCMHHKYTCLTHEVLTNYNVPSCSLSVYQADIDAIKDACNIVYAIFDKPMLSTLEYLGNGFYYILNPDKTQWTLHCHGRLDRQLIVLLHTIIQLQCGCKLYSEKQSTAILLTRNCLKVEAVRVYHPQYRNVLFLTVLMNMTFNQLNTAIRNETLPNEYPLNVKLPDLSDLAEINDDKMFDLKELLNIMSHEGHVPLSYLHDDINDLYDHTDNYNMFQIFVYVAMVILGIVSIAVLCIIIRLKGLGYLISLVSVIDKVEAGILNGDAGHEQRDHLITFDILCMTLTGCLLFIALLMILYWIYKNISYLGQYSQYLCSPFNDFRNPLQPDLANLILEFNSIDNFVHLKLDIIQSLSADLYITGQLQTDNIRLVSLCCQTHLRINWTSLELKSKTICENIRRYKIPTQIGIPCVLVHKLHHILAQPFTVNLLCGSNGIYNRLHILTNHPAPIVSDNQITASGSSIEMQPILSIIEE
jgi:hypothetical protein